MATPTLYEPPRFYRDVVIISADAALAASASSVIGDADEYVVVLSAPREWTVLAHVWDIDIARINNTLARIQPSAILLLQVSEKSASALRNHARNIPVMSAQTVDEILSQLKEQIRKDLSNVMRCRSDDIAAALLLAKQKRSLLLVDQNAPAISEEKSGLAEASHLVVLDDDEDCAPIVAANYAFSINADLLVIPRRDDDLRKEVYANIDSRVSLRGQERGRLAEAALDKIEKELEPLKTFSNREFVTYITRDFPYGYFWQDSPSTHIFSRGSGQSIVSGIYSASGNQAISSAVLIDPGFFSDSETAVISEHLRAEGAGVMLLDDKGATVNDVRLFLSVFPADFYFVCSHCGEVDGVRICVKLECHDKKEHLFEVDTVLSVESDVRNVNGTDEVLVSELFVNVAMDDISWSQVASEFKDDWARFLGRMEDIWGNVVSRKPVARVPFTTAIALVNGHFILTSLHTFDQGGTPVFFNNACGSFYDAASHFAAAGARSYIGTLAPVTDSLAREFALEVLKDEDSRTSLPVSIYNIQQRIIKENHDRIYVHVGCHFCGLTLFGLAGAKDNILRRIVLAKERWSEYMARPNVPGKDTASEALSFLSVCERVVRDKP